MSSFPFMFASMMNVVLLGVTIYAFVLFVKLANRGIKALDLYIDEKSNAKE